MRYISQWAIKFDERERTYSITSVEFNIHLGRVKAFGQNSLAGGTKKALWMIVPSSEGFLLVFLL